MEIEEDLQKAEEIKKKELEQEQKKVLKEKFIQVYDRLTKGCGRERCQFDTCINHIPNAYLKGNSVAIKNRALQLVKERLGHLKTCEKRDKLIHSLQSNEVESIILASADEGNQQQIMERIKEVFNDTDALSSSFYQNGDSKQHLDRQRGHVDYQAIIRLFSTLLKTGSNERRIIYQDILNQAFLSFVVNLRIQDDFEKEPNFEKIRIITYIFVFLGEMSDIHITFSALKKLFLDTSEDLVEILGYWTTGMEQNITRRLNEALHTHIMLILFNTDDKFDEIEAAMNVLKIFYASNTIHERMNREEFILSIFDQQQDECLVPIEEYKAWKQSKMKNIEKKIFSFCNYPFCMDIKFKYLILEIDSKYAQKIEYEKKIKNLIEQGHLFLNQSQLFLIFEVSRESILHDTITAISAQNLNFRLPFKVKFKGEQGIDEGGVRKEYYQIMIKQLFNPDFGLFNEKEKKQFFWFNGNSLDMPMLFELIGSLMGIAIYNQIQMDVRFPHVVYKKLIGDPVSIEDIQQFDNSTYNGLKHILCYEGDLENDLQQTFSIEYEVFDEVKVYELKEGGQHLPVTQENKEEYVDLYVDYILNKSIEKQFNNFKRGFFKVLDSDVTKLFTYDELTLILTGKEELDIEELRINTVYDQGYSEDSEQIKWLWEILEQEFTMEQKKRFLFFCTGSDRAPVTGFSSQRFIIARHGDDNDHLPSSHTCFNHLLIPAYKSKDILRQKLLLSMENAEGFGLH